MSTSSKGLQSWRQKGGSSPHQDTPWKSEVGPQGSAVGIFPARCCKAPGAQGDSPMGGIALPSDLGRVAVGSICAFPIVSPGGWESAEARLLIGGRDSQAGEAPLRGDCKEGSVRKARVCPGSCAAFGTHTDMRESMRSQLRECWHPPRPRRAPIHPPSQCLAGRCHSHVTDEETRPGEVVTSPRSHSW